MEKFLRDLSSGVRMLVRYPTLSLVAILTLGVGIGLSTTVFCVVNGGLFKGLPFPNADRIVAVFSSNVSQGQPRTPMSVRDFDVLRERQTSFETIGAYSMVGCVGSVCCGSARGLGAERVTTNFCCSVGTATPCCCGGAF